MKTLRHRSFIVALVLMPVAALSIPDGAAPRAGEKGASVSSLESVHVTGNVRIPGKIAWAPDLTLTAAISACGGAGWREPKTVQIERKGKVLTFEVRKIAKQPSLDPKLEPGDRVIVP